MTDRGIHSLREITTQAESWGAALAASAAQKDLFLPLFADKNQRIIFIGCGSTHYLAQFAARYFQGITGRICIPLPSSELWLQTDHYVQEGETPLVVALSRSGDTSESIQAARKLQALGSPVLTITCYDESELGKLADVVIGLPEGRERSLAQTRSFASMLVAVQAVAAMVAERSDLLGELGHLADLGLDIISRAQPLAQLIGPDEGFKRITNLGSAELYGLATEATVKMKEMSLSIVEAFRFMEFRHGPMALVDQEHLIVALLSDDMLSYELGVLDDLRARGARILAIGSETACSQAKSAEWSLSLGNNVSPAAMGVLYLPLVQLLAYYRSMGRGLNPDLPRNVVMAIRLDGTEMVS